MHLGQKKKSNRRFCGIFSFPVSGVVVAVISEVQWER